MRKKGNSAIYDNTDEPGGHHGTYKPDRERPVLQGIIYMRNLKKKQLN